MDPLSGKSQVYEGSTHLIDPEWVERAQKDLDLYHEFCKQEEELKEHYYLMQKVNRVLLAHKEGKDIIDSLKGNLGSPWDRVEAYEKFKKEKQCS